MQDSFINYNRARNTDNKGVLLSVVICCIYCVSVLIFNIGNPMIPHILFFMWVLSLMLIDKRLLKTILGRKYFAYFYIFLLYYFVASLPLFSIITCFNRVIIMFELIAPMVMYEIYSKYGNRYKKIIFFTITVLAIVNINLLRHNVASDVGLKQHADEDGFINTAYHWVYCLSIIEGLVVYMLRKIWSESFKYKKAIIILLIAFAAAILIVVVLSLYATAVIIMMIGIVLAILYGRKRWVMKSVMTSVLGVVLLTHFLPVVLNSIEKITPESTMYKNRVIEIVAITEGDVDMDYGSGGARIARSLISIETFFYHPIMGLTPITEDVIAEPPVIPGTKIGNHAEWVDDLGLFGIFALFLYAFLWQYSKRLYKNCNIAFVFVLYILLGFLNKCFYIVHMTLIFLYAPIMYDYIMSFKKDLIVKR